MEPTLDTLIRQALQLHALTGEKTFMDAIHILTTPNAHPDLVTSVRNTITRCTEAALVLYGGDEPLPRGIPPAE